jgi:hypothetical protein
MTALASGWRLDDSTKASLSGQQRQHRTGISRLSMEQLHALVLGLPWARIGNDGIITVV